MRHRATRSRAFEACGPRKRFSYDLLDRTRSVHKKRRIFSLMNLPEVRDTIQRYRGTKDAQRVESALLWTARTTGDREVQKAVSAALTACHKHGTAGRAAGMILRTALRDPGTTRALADLLRARPDLHALRFEVALTHALIYPHLVDGEFRDALTVDQIEDLAGAYEQTLASTPDDQAGFRGKVKECFFTVMNDKIALGRTGKEKGEILSLWARNVCLGMEQYRS